MTCKNNHDSAHYAIYVAGEAEEAKAIVHGGEFKAVSKSAALVGNSVMVEGKNLHGLFLKVGLYESGRSKGC